MSVNWKNIAAYVVVILLPLIPVVLLYILFKELNYFELKDNVRGVVAFGPIAAYFVLLILTWKIFVKLFPGGKITNRNIGKLMGDWQIKSASGSGTEYEGEVRIRQVDFEIDLSGTLRYERDFTAQISTVFSRLINGKLHIVYNIRDAREGGERAGYSVLDVDFKKLEMKGHWAVIKEDSLGLVEYKKI